MMSHSNYKNAKILINRKKIVIEQRKLDKTSLDGNCVVLFSFLFDYYRSNNEIIDYSLDYQLQKKDPICIQIHDSCFMNRCLSYEEHKHIQSMYMENEKLRTDQIQVYLENGSIYLKMLGSQTVYDINNDEMQFDIKIEMNRLLKCQHLHQNMIQMMLYNALGELVGLVDIDQLVEWLQKDGSLMIIDNQVIFDIRQKVRQFIEQECEIDQEDERELIINRI